MPDTTKRLKRRSGNEFPHIVQRAIDLPDAPPMLVRAAIALWPSTPPIAPKSAGQAALRFVTAALSFDSWSRPRVEFGMRAAVSDTRHLLFRALGRDVDLRISPATEHFTLTGQVLGPNASGTVKLVKQCGDRLENPDSRVVSFDALGEFRFDSVRGGTYRLILRMGSNSIGLPPVEVGARPK